MTEPSRNKKGKSMIKSEVGLINAQAKRKFIDLIKQDEQLINREFGIITQKIYTDLKEKLENENTVDAEKSLKIVLTEQLKNQFFIYSQMVDKEMEKKKPKQEIIKWAQDKKQALILDGMDLLRKMNEGEHEMRYGKKKININTDLKTLEEWAGIKKIDVIDGETVEDKPSE